MIRRVCRRFLYLALGTGVFLLLLLGLLIWRLIEEPIPLNLLTPYIETALPSSLNGFQIDVQDVVLDWHRQAKRIVLSARDIHLRDAQGIVDASLPTVDVTLNLPMLLRQRVAALNKVYINGAHFHVQADTYRPHELEPTAPLIPTLPPPSYVVEALETVLTALERHTLFADFRTVHVFNSSVTVYHNALPRPLSISELTLTLSRTGDSVNSNLRFTTSLSDTDVKFTLNTTYERSAHQLSLKSEFANLRPSALSTLAPALATFSGTTIPLTGSLDFQLVPQDTWPVIHFNIRGAAGQVTLPSLYRAPLNSILKFF